VSGYDPRSAGAADARFRACEICKKLFRRDRPNREARGLGRFCSIACSARGHESSSLYRGHGGRHGRVHTRIAALAYGEPLRSAWQVHHVNEIKFDNTPSNLVICTSRRAHSLLHACPSLLNLAQWLGPVDSSVRFFDPATPSGFRYCAQCGQIRSIQQFDRSAKYLDGLRGECRVCRYGR
jgi:hypothetical protein